MHLKASELPSQDGKEEGLGSTSCLLLVQPSVFFVFGLWQRTPGWVYGKVRTNS
jgi:hypothetical protein